MWFFPLFGLSIEYKGKKLAAELSADQLSGEGIQFDVNLFWIYASFILISVGTIFFFKKRKTQLLLCRLNLISQALFASGIYAFYYFGRNFLAREIFPGPGEATIQFHAGVGIYLLVVPIAFIWLAIRGIKRDEELLKSIERLR